MRAAVSRAPKYPPWTVAVYPRYGRGLTSGRAARAATAAAPSTREIPRAVACRQSPTGAATPPLVKAQRDEARAANCSARRTTPAASRPGAVQEHDSGIDGGGPRKRGGAGEPHAPCRRRRSSRRRATAPSARGETRSGLRVRPSVKRPSRAVRRLGLRIPTSSHRRQTRHATGRRVVGDVRQRDLDYAQRFGFKRAAVASLGRSKCIGEPARCPVAAATSDPRPWRVSAYQRRRKTDRGEHRKMVGSARALSFLLATTAARAERRYAHTPPPIRSTGHRDAMLPRPREHFPTANALHGPQPRRASAPKRRHDCAMRRRCEPTVTASAGTAPHAGPALACAGCGPAGRRSRRLVARVTSVR